MAYIYTEMKILMDIFPTVSQGTKFKGHVTKQRTHDHMYHFLTKIYIFSCHYLHFQIKFHINKTKQNSMIHT